MKNRIVQKIVLIVQVNVILMVIVQIIIQDVMMIQKVDLNVILIVQKYIGIVIDVSEILVALSVLIKIITVKNVWQNVKDVVIQDVIFKVFAVNLSAKTQHMD